MQVFFYCFCSSFSSEGPEKRYSSNFYIRIGHPKGFPKHSGNGHCHSQGVSIVLQAGLGYADLKNGIKVTPNTTFRVASITKTFTSTIIMQLVEQGKLNLGTPITAFGIDFGNPNITVRHVLTHTSEGEPGRFFQYNGYRLSFLQKIRWVCRLQRPAFHYTSISGTGNKKT
jgi:CubicO group peptidase (beta-lactamase class C family)